MKAASRIQTVIDILDKIADSHIPMDNTIRDYMANRRYIGSKDRAAIVEMVYAVIRNYARLGWHLGQAGVLPTARNFVVAHLTLEKAHMEVLFTGEKHAPAPLSEEEEKWRTNLGDESAMPIEVKCECPDWAAEKLKAVFGDEFENEMRGMIDPAPLDLRVNTVKGSREKAAAMLEAQSVQTNETPYSPFGLRVEGKAFMSATKAFSKGLVEIQDEGSQLIALACDVKPGMRVLDYCAGAGGKTLGLAAMMENKGNIVAMDIDDRRLDKGKSRFRKADVHNVELRKLSDEKNKKWLRRQKEAMDVVLVDAPCTSSGTWRRNPDLRWKQYGPSMEEIMEMQADILERVADKVKLGGRLVYATCSLFREENEEQVEKFLNNHPEFRVCNLKHNWSYGDFPCDGPYLRLSPLKHNTDGFFTAVLIRQ